MVYIDKDFESLVPFYFENISKQLSNIKKLLESSQFRDIEKVAMQIRDSGLNYGFSAIGELGAGMIHYSGLEASENIYGAIREIEAYIESCKIEYIEL